MVDFKKMMSPEERQRFEATQRYLLRERVKLRKMSSAELAKYAQTCVDNSASPRQLDAGTPVYDNAVWHLVLPELIFRVGLGVTDTDLDRVEQLLFAMSRGADGPYLTGGGNYDCMVYMGPLDDNGYVDIGHSRTINLADCSMGERPNETGRAIAALLNAAPELLRLARLGKLYEAEQAAKQAPEPTP